MPKTFKPAADRKGKPYLQPDETGFLLSQMPRADTRVAEHPDCQLPAPARQMRFLPNQNQHTLSLNRAADRRIIRAGRLAIRLVLITLGGLILTAFLIS